MSKNIDEYIEKATENITEDRASTKVLLLTLMNYMKKGDDRHKEVGLIAAKYLETLQRSNEQLVKLAALIQKKETGNNEISESDKQELFDLINEENKDG
tara:strand:- start:803 stop:1099 length:297 start_codon:yes stop_codon:yes gene_type:complete